MLSEPHFKQLLWSRLLDHGIFYATELMARLPENLVLSLAEARLRRSIPWNEGVDYLVQVLRMLHRHWGELNPNVRQRFVRNVFGHSGLRNGDKRRWALEHLGDYPVVMVISPTMRCNLRCHGCYSYHYDRTDGISSERLDRLYSECEQLGIHYIVVTGGEPFKREDTLDLFAAHPDLTFMTYTNGTVIHDRDLVGRLVELGNVLPCISVEGFEEHTDARRGPGVYRKIIDLMRQMHDAGLLFGFSATPMRHNHDLLTSDEFVSHYYRQGCRFGWYFSYMPVGRSPDLNLMPTPEQRLRRYRRIRELRASQPLLVSDFWCDSMLTGGCLSGGRTYFHVNAAGGVEPCVFQQFATDNINDKSLVECLSSPFMRGVRRKIREVDNPLRPCPVIDNPQMLRDLVTRYQPVPSQAGSDDLLNGAIAAGLDRYAEELAGIMDPLFEQVGADYPWPLEQPADADSRPAAKKHGA